MVTPRLGGGGGAGSSSSMAFHGLYSRGGLGAGFGGRGASMPTAPVRTTLRSSQRFTGGGSNSPGRSASGAAGTAAGSGSGARNRSHTGRGAAAPSTAADGDGDPTAPGGGRTGPPTGSGPVRRGAGSTLAAAA